MSTGLGQSGSCKRVCLWERLSAQAFARWAEHIIMQGSLHASLCVQKRPSAQAEKLVKTYDEFAGAAKAIVDSTKPKGTKRKSTASASAQPQA